MTDTAVMDLVADLLNARFERHPVPRPSTVANGFDLAAAYRIAGTIEGELHRRGWRSIGRKLGFTNRATWNEFDLDTAIWAPVYDQTVVESAAGDARISVAGCLAPRIEPEIVVGVSVANERRDDPVAIAWIAPGFEIVDCHFDVGWQFNAADIVADFGAHAYLVVGPKVPVNAIDRRVLADELAAVTVALSCNGAGIDHGTGRNALDGPVAALDDLCNTLARDPAAPALVDGEIITTGTLTSIPRIKPGEHWLADFSGAGLSALRLCID